MNPTTLLGCLEFSSTHFPNNTALVGPDGTSMTYTEMNRQAGALAGYLSWSGIGCGSRVGLMLPKSAEAIIAIFGVMKAGAAYVPIDPLATERSQQIMIDAHLDACFVEPRSLPSVSNVEAGAKPRVVIVVGGDADSLTSPAISYQAAVSSGEDSSRNGPLPADLAYLMYTSGSTGVPKGVMITHQNAISFLNWSSSLMPLNSEDRFGATVPLHFDPSIMYIFQPLLHGASVCVIPDHAGLNPKELAAFIANRRLTVLCSSPSTLMLLAQFGRLEAIDASSLRMVIFGGEVFPVKHLRELKRHWPRPVYYNSYGPTETTVACTSFRIPDTIPEDREQPYPIGFPAPHCQTLVIDAQGQEVQPSEQGLLHISGPSVSPGYWNRPAESAAAFVTRNGQRWYNTGDWVRWDSHDGFIYLGRKDRMVKRRGYRIELDEIERAFYQHPRVREAAVVSAPGLDGTVSISAFLALHAGESLSLLDCKTFCASKLPSYMSPDHILFQDNLPRTPAGKVDYQALIGGLETQPKS